MRIILNKNFLELLVWLPHAVHHLKANDRYWKHNTIVPSTTHVNFTISNVIIRSDLLKHSGNWKSYVLGFHKEGDM